ncbi:unnamed protein product [Chrysoparadoxa australica]
MLKAFVLLFLGIGLSPASSSNVSSMRSYLPPPPSLTAGVASEARVEAADNKALVPVNGVVSSHGRDGDEAVENLPQISRLRVALRALYLAAIFLPPLLTSPLAIFLTWCRPMWYALLVNTIAWSGAAFIKWGQWSSTRPDMFPEALCQALAVLHSTAPTHGYSHSKRLVERALGGRPIAEIFDWFGKEPMASGSIAQVHKAVLDGKVVAVKVRHPHVKERLHMDFLIMKWLARQVDRVPGLRWLNLGPSMEQFSHTMGAQARLDVEALHLDIFNDNFSRWNDVVFPEAIYASEDVLIETYEEGFLISEYVAQYNGSSSKASKGKKWVLLEDWLRWVTRTPKHMYEEPAPIDPALAHFTNHACLDICSKRLAMCAMQELPNGKLSPSPRCHLLCSTDTSINLLPLFTVVSKGEDIYLKMLLVDNLMHADLHPGNMMIHEVDNKPFHLVLVDLGMVAQLLPDEATNFIGFLECLGSGSGVGAAKKILLFSQSQSCTGEENQLAFIAELNEFFLESCRGYNTGVDVGEVLRGCLKIIRKHHVRIDVNYATLIMNILCLDGLAKTLWPEYSILDASRPLLEAHAKFSKRTFMRLLPLLHMAKVRKDQKFLRDAIRGAI